MQKNGVARRDNARVEGADSAETYGVRGAGASTWQAKFGMQLNERDLLFAVRREPIAKRTVFDVAHDIFSKGFTVEEASEEPDPNWTREVSKVLDGLNARANLTRLLVYERLFGWAILALTYVDFGDGAGSPGLLPRDLAVRLGQFKTTRHQVSRRILRMNKRLKKEFGEHVAEKRGWHWALTSFAVEVWGETETGSLP